MNRSTNDIFSVLLKIIVWTLVATVGITIFLTIIEGLMAFASTGIGAIILLLVGYKIYKTYKEMN